ncbi:mechanosensitive ion channel family protein [Legionella impletisoli]|uniref:Small-conductance mechanosensitive channel n=1 Tax=Legionella impletisoli TaxID=343510 RepID=A0A917JT42_9GAMM|nr:mechanosensitive ion channel family protein [Legionella impletisoli]GGI85245.1 mechanosensitive ion channel protein MscS [Legionella impletisoli]
MEFLSTVNWLGLFYALALLIIGLIVAKQVSSMVERAVTKRFSRHQALLTRRLIFYALLFIFVFSALQQLGFKLTVLLGAAGVFTVALSFASQTAASNLVSGIFLIFECPFKVGDTIKMKDLLGTVDSIDLLSTKILTPDNMRIRIPNETIVKSEIINMSYFKTRRIDILIGVSYKSDIEQIKKVLLDLAHNNPDVLDNPAPQAIINNFADSAIEIKFMTWTDTKKFVNVRAQLNEQIKKRFDEEQIEMPYPQITLHRA